MIPPGTPALGGPDDKLPIRPLQPAVLPDSAAVSVATAPLFPPCLGASVPGAPLCAQRYGGSPPRRRCHARSAANHNGPPQRPSGGAGGRAEAARSMPKSAVAVTSLRGRARARACSLRSKPSLINSVSDRILAERAVSGISAPDVILRPSMQIVPTDSNYIVPRSGPARPPHCRTSCSLSVLHADFPARPDQLPADRAVYSRVQFGGSGAGGWRFDAAAGWPICRFG